MIEIETPVNFCDKFSELILFIAQRSECDPTFGATKLNKLLFYSDFVAYLRFGKSITGQRYQKLPNGPAPRAMVPVIERMVDQHEIAKAERNFYGNTQKRIIALRDPDLSGFSSEEIALVTQLLQDFAQKNARQISELSHRFRGWQLAGDGEDIPYEVALVEFEPLGKADSALVANAIPSTEESIREMM